MTNSLVKTFFTALLSALLFTSCEKKVFEIVPVIDIVEDLSIEGASDVKYFSFPSENTGFAAAGDSIYKTIDGGNTWTILTVTGKCNGMEFFDTLNGMCLIGKGVQITHDGGDTWTLAHTADFIGITSDGVGVTGECDYANCYLKGTSTTGLTFLSAGSIRLDGDFLRARVVNTRVYVIGDDAYYYDKVIGKNLKTGGALVLGFDNLTAGENPTDMYITDSSGVVVGPGGLIMERGYSSYSRRYFDHLYNYYSVDGWGDLKLAVGEKTMAANYYIDGEPWSEVFDRDGNGFIQTFYKVRFIDQHTCYISGSDGLIWKAKLYS